MLSHSQQAYLRTRLAILNARRKGLDELFGLLELSAEDLAERFGLPVDLASHEGLDGLERHLMQIWLDELSALLRPLEGPARALLVQWARRYELLNLKALIRGKLGGMERRDIERSLFSLPGFLTLDHDALLNTDDIHELLRRLQETPYRRLARRASRQFEEQQDPFLLDATLDQQFYSELWDHVMRLGERDRTPMRALVGLLLDRHNLIWIFRYRFNYGLQASEIVYLSIDGGLQVGRPQLHDMAHAASFEECLNRLPASLHKLLVGSEHVREVEHRLVENLSAHAERALRSSPSVLASVFGYLILRYDELKTTHAIVQARAMGLSDELLTEALFPLLEKAS